MSSNAEKTIEKTRFWDELRGTMRSRNGGWIMGQGVFCQGYNLLEELAGEVSYFQFLVLNATGRLPDKAFADWLEAAYTCMSWPDPRIWCNQVAALAGSMRTQVMAANAAGIQTAISRAYGPKTLIEGTLFIQNALARHRQGKSAREIVAEECAAQGGKPYIMGFARPIAKGDERIVAMERISARLGLPVGEHLQLAYAMEKVLMAEYDEGMNLTGYMSAFLADQGFTPDEVGCICATLVASGLTACYADTAGRPPESFFPLRCDDIDYQGKPPRPVPAKEE